MPRRSQDSAMLAKTFESTADVYEGTAKIHYSRARSTATSTTWWLISRFCCFRMVAAASSMKGDRRVLLLAGEKSTDHYDTISQHFERDVTNLGVRPIAVRGRVDGKHDMLTSTSSKPYFNMCKTLGHPTNNACFVEAKTRSQIPLAERRRVLRGGRRK